MSVECEALLLSSRFSLAVAKRAKELNAIMTFSGDSGDSGDTAIKENDMPQHPGGGHGKKKGGKKKGKKK